MNEQDQAAEQAKLAKPIWYVVFPTHQYVEDVKQLAQRNGLRIVNALFDRGDGAPEVPELTKKPDAGKPPAAVAAPQLAREKSPAAAAAEADASAHGATVALEQAQAALKAAEIAAAKAVAASEQAKAVADSVAGDVAAAAENGSTEDDNQDGTGGDTGGDESNQDKILTWLRNTAATAKPTVGATETELGIETTGAEIQAAYDIFKADAAG